jgi:hypothetical protein
MFLIIIIIIIIIIYKKGYNRNSAYVDVKTKVIPVITGTTETISKSVRQYLCDISGEHKIKEL